ncbi:metal ABC transporter ATP-binding protein [bacterium]|nr:metal ABC transporter ATP-binding protein [bacterium]
MKVLPGDPLITLKNIDFSYDRKGPMILSNISAIIKKGDFIGVIGLNGSGKTTLLRIILRLLNPTVGEVIYHENIRMAYVPQETSLNREVSLSVESLIRLSLTSGRVFSKLHSPDDISQAIEAVGMTVFKDHLFFELSGGQKQKILIARALAAKPHLLILDEPNAGFDEKARDSFYNTLEELYSRYGLTIMMVTHDLSIIPSLSKTIFCVHGGMDVHDKPEEALTCPMMQRHLGTHLEILLHGSSTPHRVVRKHKEEK